MKSSKVIIISLPLLLSFSTALQADPFDDFDQEIAAFENPNTEQEAIEFAKFVSEYLSEFDQWRSAYVSKFDQQQQAVAKKWGAAEVSEKDKSVEYSSDSTLKSVIDYEKNEMIIEVLVDESLTEEEATQVLVEKVAKASDGDASNLADVVINKEQINVKNISVSQVKYSEEDEAKSKEIITLQTQTYLQDVEKEADKLVLDNSEIPLETVEKVILEKKKQIKKEEAIRIASVAKEYEELRSESVKKEISEPKLKVVKYKVKLPKYGLAKRAELYIPYAEKESKRFDLPVALVMAIMHSESSFDHKAKSPIPAFGLMQIVPRSAGHDVNKFIRNIDKPMNSKELYIPDVNVETGAAYLSILDKRYLKAIEHPQSRLYCTIAAYNTGAGNVSKVFNKKGAGSTRSVSKAAKIINTLSPEEVYEQLIKKLPYDETKHYLKKVSQRMPLYQTKA